MTLHPITTNYRRSDDSVESHGALLYAGGTDLIPLARGGIVGAPDLVDIKSSSLSSAIEATDDEWVIGALTTLRELERHDELQKTMPLIAQALSQVATIQIRNRATVGGNLLQRPRCSYFRDADVDCFMKGGDTCPAIDGRNEHLALSGERCAAPQPSDLASVLVALGADVMIATGFDTESERRVSVADFLVAPSDDRQALHALADGELITSIRIPQTKDREVSSVYLKAMDRAVWHFALVGIAAVVTWDSSGKVERASLCASGVSNTPLELPRAAESLVGSALTPATIERAAATSVEGLDSLSENHFKITLLRGLVTRSLESVQLQSVQS